MAATALTLGGVTLADPQKFNRSFLGIGSQVRMFDQSLKTFYAATAKQKIEISWERLTEAEKDIIETRANTQGTQVLKPIDTASTITVFVMLGSYSCEFIGADNDNLLFDCSLTLEQV